MPIIRACLIAVAIILLPGCRGSRVMDPGTRVITGVVQSLEGAPVQRALVSSESGVGVFTDGHGEFSLVVPAGRPVRLRARDGYDSRYAYAVTHSGSILIQGEQPGSGHVIVLDHAENI